MNEMVSPSSSSYFSLPSSSQSTSLTSTRIPGRLHATTRQPPRQYACHTRCSQTQWHVHSVFCSKQLWALLNNVVTYVDDQVLQGQSTARAAFFDLSPSTRGIIRRPVICCCSCRWCFQRQLVHLLLAE